MQHRLYSQAHRVNMDRVGVLFVSVCVLASVVLSSSDVDRGYGLTLEASNSNSSVDFSLNAATVDVGDEVNVTCYAPANMECSDNLQWCVTFPKEECIADGKSFMSCYSFYDLLHELSVCLDGRFQFTAPHEPYDYDGKKAYTLSFNITGDLKFDGMLISCRRHCDKSNIYSQPLTLQQDAPCPPDNTAFTTIDIGTVASTTVTVTSTTTVSASDSTVTITVTPIPLPCDGEGCSFIHEPIAQGLLAILAVIIFVLITVIVVLLLIIKSQRKKLPTVIDFSSGTSHELPSEVQLSGSSTWNSPTKQSIYNSESATSFMY